MTGTLTLGWQPQRVQEFDQVVTRFESSLLSFSEAEALKAAFWDFGEDARLREDERFCRTPWGRWTLADRNLINDRLFAQLQSTPDERVPLAEVLPRLKSASGGPPVFCPWDHRFIVKAE